MLAPSSHSLLCAALVSPPPPASGVVLLLQAHVCLWLGLLSLWAAMASSIET